MAKRTRSPEPGEGSSSQTTSSRQVRFKAVAQTVKVEPTEDAMADVDVKPEDVKPDVKPKLEDYSPTTTSISLSQLDLISRSDLRALLLACCAASPDADALISAALPSRADVEATRARETDTNSSATNQDGSVQATGCFPSRIWQVICKQADASTLERLCLVSLGMLELAGPALYDHVDLKPTKDLRGLFLAPPMIPLASRLYLSLGTQHVRFVESCLLGFDRVRFEEQIYVAAGRGLLPRQEAFRSPSFPPVSPPSASAAPLLLDSPSS